MDRLTEGDRLLDCVVSSEDEFASHISMTGRSAACERTIALHDMSIYIVSKNDSFVWHKAHSLIGDFSKIFFHDAEDPAFTISFFNDDYVLVVDIDVFECLDNAIDWLLKVRSINSSMPIAILSDKFTYDDLTLQRNAIADVSVRTPCTVKFLKGAIALAIENNTIYRKQLFNSSNA